MSLHDVLQFTPIAEAIDTRSIRQSHTEPGAPDGTLLKLFDSQFEVLPANTLERIRTAQRIRYQVYCIENEHESADHPDGEEIDSYDAHAVQSLLIHKTTQTPIGTVRLILPERESLDSSFALQTALDTASSRKFRALPLDRIGEVSRFSVSRQFRRFTEVAGGEHAASGPLMRLGLIQALVQMSLENGITHWCAAMEPTLLRMLAAMAIRFKPIGPLVDYHGLRQPAYCVLADVLKAVREERPAFWSILTNDGALTA